VYDALGGPRASTIEADDTGWRLARCFLSAPGDVDGGRRSGRLRLSWSNAAKESIYRAECTCIPAKDGHRLSRSPGKQAGEGSARVHLRGRGSVDGGASRRPVVVAWQYSGQAIGAGRAYLSQAKTAILVRTYTSRIPAIRSGFDAVTLGDVDGDGITDFLKSPPAGAAFTEPFGPRLHHLERGRSVSVR